MPDSGVLGAMVLSAVIYALYFYVACWLTNRPRPDDSQLLMLSLSGSSIPVYALALAVPFKPSLIGHIENHTLYLALFGGVCLIHVLKMPFALPRAKGAPTDKGGASG